MQIIDELEKEKRGIYAGAVGYFSAAGEMDTCIVLRTALVKDGRMYVQAGAGIVADSNPKSEQTECVNKAKALFHAAEEARRFASAAELADVLARLRGEADLRRVLVVAGDAVTAGPYADALALIQGGKLRDAGIEEIGITGYPEGHPAITADKIEAALDQKIAAARAAGLSVHIVSQFSFDPEAIVAWLARLRKCGVTVPVKVGMAGPTSIPSLLRYAKRCGVGASLKGLMSGAASSLLGHVGPDRIVAALEAARNEIGEAHPHYFSFGGVAETARYAREKSEKAATADTVTASC